MPQPAGPRTLAARALLTRAPGGRSTMRGVAMAELGRLLVRVEDEATAAYRDALRWALDELERRPADLSSDGTNRLAEARDLLDRA